MKQKNMLLIAVAVGCGLVAAILTSQVSSRPAAPPMQEVFVAAKDLPLNTKLTKEDLRNLVTTKQIPKDLVPPQIVVSEDDLVGKVVIRPLRSQDVITPTDVGARATVELPPGFDMITIPISRDQLVGGFALPGSRVDLIASMSIPKGGQNLSIVFPLLTDMLILAVDLNTVAPVGETARITVTDVSLAVTKDQALMLHAALNRGAQMRVILRNTSEHAPKYEKNYTKDEIWAILRGDYDPKPGKPDEDKNKGPEVVELPVLIEDLKPGTRLTKELIDTKFEMVKIIPPAPVNVIKDIQAHAGQYLQKELFAGQYVPKSFLGATEPRTGEGKPAPVPNGDTSEKVGPPPEPKTPASSPKPPPTYWDVTVQTVSGMKKYRYQVLKNGTYKYLGEVRPEPPAVTDEDEKPAEKPTGPKVIRTY